MIEQCLKHTGIRREEVDCLAVSAGPGSYMGTRMAVSIAHGWRLARPIKLYPVRSVDCIAFEARVEANRGKLMAVMDAQRGEFYAAGFELGDTDFVETLSLAILKPEEVKSCKEKGYLVAGPLLNKTFPDALELWPRARGACFLAVGSKRFVDAGALAPIYLRETTFVKAAPSRMEG
jgi:tRNA threonylcarbamoyladenosine biosynthesis protein TsaB